MYGAMRWLSKTRAAGCPEVGWPGPRSVAWSGRDAFSHTRTCAATREGPFALAALHKCTGLRQESGKRVSCPDSPPAQ